MVKTCYCNINKKHWHWTTCGWNLSINSLHNYVLPLLILNLSELVEFFIQCQGWLNGSLLALTLDTKVSHVQHFIFLFKCTILTRAFHFLSIHLHTYIVRRITITFYNIILILYIVCIYTNKNGKKYL